MPDIFDLCLGEAAKDLVRVSFDDMLGEQSSVTLSDGTMHNTVRAIYGDALFPIIENHPFKAGEVYNLYVIYQDTIGYAWNEFYFNNYGIYESGCGTSQDVKIDSAYLPGELTVYQTKITITNDTTQVFHYCNDGSGNTISVLGVAYTYQAPPATVNDKMTAICDNIRAKTGGTEKLNLDKIADGVNAVYDAGQAAGYESGHFDGYNNGYEIGYEKGKADGGSDTYYNDMWDLIQSNGNKTDYRYVFTGYGWTDTNFKPKYPMKPTHLAYAFERSRVKTSPHLKEIDFSTCGAIVRCFASSTVEELGVVDCANVQPGWNGLNQVFYDCSGLRKIEKLVLPKNKASLDAFQSCPALEDITFEGIAYETVNLQWSKKLSIASMKSLISCLYNQTGTSFEFSFSIKFSEESWAALEADSTAPDGGTWREYVQSLGWNT